MTQKPEHAAFNLEVGCSISANVRIFISFFLFSSIFDYLALLFSVFWYVFANCSFWTALHMPLSRFIKLGYICFLVIN